jgi:hypothetical protein
MNGFMWREAIPNESRSLLRFRRAQEDAQMARQARRIAIESAGTTMVVNPRATRSGDARKLRGLPALAAGVCGEMQGTRPDRAVVNVRRKS